MLTEIQIKKIRAIIENQEEVVIISHLNPDGDSVGSSLGLSLFFRKLQVPATVIIPNEVPDFLQWLPGFDQVRVYTKSRKACKDALSAAKTIFYLDFNDPSRMGDELKAVNKDHAFSILIDHHQNPLDFTDMTISEPWRGSSGEMIYLFIESLGKKSLLDKDISTCLYVAIMTDTGNFRYGSSYSEVFRIAGELVENNINKDEIFSLVYDSFSYDRMKLLGYCMSQKLVLLKEEKAAYIYISQEELDRFNYKVGDTEGFVNVPFSIEGVRVSGLFIEKKDHVKVSLRSKGSFSVDTFAAAYFQGGGHINAAGGESPLSLQETIKNFEELLIKHRDEITSD